MIIPFQHKSQAHCESGVTSNLLKHYGLPISEPMAFGIGSGIFFGHLPFVKVNGVPGTTYRIYPSQIFKNVCKRLHITFESKKFSNAKDAMAALRKNIDKQIPTDCQVSVYFLPFLPEVFRFHFNAHNLIVYGYDSDQYMISDPVMEDVTQIHETDFAKARFAKGYPEPKGRMYYITKVPDIIDIPNAVIKGIKQTCFYMTSPPVPWFGVNAIQFLAKKLKKYPEKLTARQCTLYLGNLVRMQEEIGTGGAGFRYLYAAFLQEASTLPSFEFLADFSKQMTAIGDEWRTFAYNTARICKERTTQKIGYDALSHLLMNIYTKEKLFFEQLRKSIQ